MSDKERFLGFFEEFGIKSSPVSPEDIVLEMEEEVEWANALSVGQLWFLFGSKDEFVPGEDRGQLQNVLDEAHLDWQLIIYSDAVRGFSNPKLGFEVIDGMAYNYNADLRSFDAMRQFFTDLLK